MQDFAFTISQFLAAAFDTIDIGISCRIVLWHWLLTGHRAICTPMHGEKIEPSWYTRENCAIANRRIDASAEGNWQNEKDRSKKKSG